ncbi:hypothetical protein [Candidatus Palauibacter sp.]|uniref:hypothetical protein n=1 Tax=Candidatus Palauibacter sp. TaxID=3101350 RepID=UPI003B027593
MTLPTLSDLSTKDLSEMRDRTKKRIEDDERWLQTEREKLNDLKRMLKLIQFELERRSE